LFNWGAAVQLFDYSKTQATAQRLIKRFGQEATLLRVAVIPGGGSEFDPEPDQVIEEAFPLTIVDLNSQIQPANPRDPAPMTKHSILIAPDATVEPLESDRLILQGREYGIAAVRRVSPGPLALLWEADLAD